MRIIPHLQTRQGDSVELQGSRPRTYFIAREYLLTGYLLSAVLLEIDLWALQLPICLIRRTGTGTALIYRELRGSKTLPQQCMHFDTVPWEIKRYGREFKFSEVRITETWVICTIENYNKMYRKSLTIFNVLFFKI